jgi:IPT/TIG domain
VKWAAGKRPVTVNWTSPDAAAFDVNLAANEAVLLKVNHDPSSRAAGATVESDPIGFQLIRAQPGQRHVALRFGASWDTWLGRAITLLTIVLLLARVRALWIVAVAVIPAVAAWGVLLAQAPPTTRVAEDAFIRLQPPLINPQGIVEDATPQGRMVSMYGLNFGGPNDSVRVWLGDRPVSPEYRDANLIKFRLPGDAPAAPVSVEVNGCRGNSFQP